MTKYLCLFLITLCFSCSNYETNDLNKITVKNVSLTDIIFAVVDSNAVSNILTAKDINTYAISSINIFSESESEIFLNDGDYIFYYCYDNFFGPLTEGENIKVFSISRNDLYVEINKRGWQIK